MRLVSQVKVCSHRPWGTQSTCISTYIVAVPISLHSHVDQVEQMVQKDCPKIPHVGLAWLEPTTLRSRVSCYKPVGHYFPYVCCYLTYIA